MADRKIPVEWHTALPIELLAAIGRVAHSSALMDEMLAEFAEDLTGNIESWVFIPGQSTEWLIQTCRVLLDVTADPQRRKFTDQFHQDIGRALDRASELRNLRNRVIHGAWSQVQFDESPLPRPWGGAHSGDVYWVGRPRQRRGSEEQAMTVSDVDRLADEIELVTENVIRGWRSVIPHDPEWPPFRRWGYASRDVGTGC